MNPATKSPTPWWPFTLRITCFLAAALISYLAAYGPLVRYAVRHWDLELYRTVAQFYQPVTKLIEGTSLSGPWQSYRQWWIRDETDQSPMIGYIPPAPDPLLHNLPLESGTTLHSLSPPPNPPAPALTP
jgi:hypothetical protein